MVTENLLTAGRGYKNTQIIGNMNIVSGDTSSQVINCLGVQLRGLLFPANWTPCNVSFVTSGGPDVDLTYTLFLKTNSDGSALLIPTIASQDLPLIPFYFDYVNYLQLVCDTEQSDDVTVLGLFEPIYQGIHG